jgi:hypothetical protein
MYSGAENARNQVSRGGGGLSFEGEFITCRPPSSGIALVLVPLERHPVVTVLVGHPHRATSAVDENLCMPPFDSRPVARIRLPSPPSHKKRFRDTDSIQSYTRTLYHTLLCTASDEYIANAVDVMCVCVCGCGGSVFAVSRAGKVRARRSGRVGGEGVMVGNCSRVRRASNV